MSYDKKYTPTSPFPITTFLLHFPTWKGNQGKLLNVNQSQDVKIAPSHLSNKDPLELSANTLDCPTCQFTHLSVVCIDPVTERL